MPFGRLFGVSQLAGFAQWYCERRSLPHHDRSLRRGGGVWWVWGFGNDWLDFEFAQRGEVGEDSDIGLPLVMESQRFYAGIQIGA